MALLARIVIPGAAHHVTQRGNCRLPVFFSDDDRQRYLDLLRSGCEQAQRSGYGSMPDPAEAWAEERLEG